MLLSAFGLGAAHALEPGHGKTVVAAYLVGSRGRTIDAVLLGGIVTLTHTSSVFVLAVLSTVAAAYLVPNQVQQWLSIGSGVLVTGVGLWMIYARTRYGPPAHSHDHGHSHEHSAAHSHAASSHHASDSHDHPEVRLGSLVALGVSGGIVPCPAALLLIPAAMGLGAVLKGLFLVVSFSLGLALVLMGIGVITLRTAGFASQWLERGEWTKRLSIASAYFITVLGLALTVKALLAPSGLH
jgi:ABC-type nickel/cobalt efflux system permease component RcnA